MAGRRISIIVDSHGVNRVARDLGKLNTIGDRVARTFRTITSRIAGFAKSLWQHKLMIAAAAGGMAYTVFRPFMNLEYTLARVRVASGATVEELAKLKDMAAALGRDTLYSATDAAEGMLYLAKAGMNVQQIYKAIPGVLNAAIVEQLDLGTAADIVTGLLNEFKLSADKAGIAADVLAKGSNLAKTDMVQMSEALKMFGAVAHDMGYSIQDAVAMLDVLAGSMIRGTMAGTALRTAMMSFQQMITGHATSAAKDTFKRLGLNLDKIIKDVKAGKLDFLGFTALLRQSGATAGDLANIFEKRTAAAILTLGDAVNTAFPTLVKALEDAEGYSAEAGAVMEHTLWGQIQQIKSSIQTMTNAIAETFAPGIEDFLEHTMRPKINEITEAWQEGGDTWQEKLKNVWDTQLRPVMEEGLASIKQAIVDWTPKLAKAMGTLASEMVVPLATGLAQGIGDLFKTAGEGWWAAINKYIGAPVANFFGKTLPEHAKGFALNTWGWLTKREYGPQGLAISPDWMLPEGMSIEPLYQSPLQPALPPLPQPAPAAHIPSTREVDMLRTEVEQLREATEDNTAAVTENTSARSSSSFWSQAGKTLVDWGVQLIQKGGQQFLGSLEGVLIGAVTDPVTEALKNYLGPTMTKLEQFAGSTLHILDPLVAIFNRGLDVLTDIFGGPPYTEGRYTGAGAYQYAYAGGASAPMAASASGYSAAPWGGVNAESSVHIEHLEIHGPREDVGDEVVAELARYEEMTTRQMARSLQMGMLKREAMER